MRDKTVGVLLVTYQSAEDLPSFLDSLEAAVEPLQLDVVCVDNTSTDNGPDLVEAYGGRGGPACGGRESGPGEWAGPAATAARRPSPRGTRL